MNYILGIAIAFLLTWGFTSSVAGDSRQLFGYPLLLLLVAYIYSVQVVGFLFAKLLNTEKFYDLTGSLTYITATLMALYLCP